MSKIIKFDNYQNNQLELVFWYVCISTKISQ